MASLLLPSSLLLLLVATTVDSAALNFLPKPGVNSADFLCSIFPCHNGREVNI